MEIQISGRKDPKNTPSVSQHLQLHVNHPDQHLREARQFPSGRLARDPGPDAQVLSGEAKGGEIQRHGLRHAAQAVHSGPGVTLRLVSVFLFVSKSLFVRRFTVGEWPVHFRKAICSRRPYPILRPGSEGANLDTFDTNHSQVLLRLVDLFASQSRIGARSRAEFEAKRDIKPAVTNHLNPERRPREAHPLGSEVLRQPGLVGRWVYFLDPFFPNSEFAAWTIIRYNKTEGSKSEGE